MFLLVNSGTKQDSTDKNLCIRLGHLINIFHELLQTALPSGQCAELLIKAVGHFYAVLTTLVKWASFNNFKRYIDKLFFKLTLVVASLTTKAITATDDLIVDVHLVVKV